MTTALSVKLPSTSHLPAGENATAGMPSGSCREKHILPDASSHTTACPTSLGSDETAARCLPSGEKARARTDVPVLSGLSAQTSDVLIANNIPVIIRSMSALHRKQVPHEHGAVGLSSGEIA